VNNKISRRIATLEKRLVKIQLELRDLYLESREGEVNPNVAKKYLDEPRFL
jgi:hypothetical protein